MNNPRLEIAVVERELSDLLAAYPELAEDEDFKLDVIEGQTGALELLAKYLDREREADSQARAIKERIDALCARRDAAERRKEAFRKLMHRIMSAADLRKVPLAEATLSVRSVPPSALIVDEAAIPAEFKKTKIEVSKSAVAEALKSGKTVPGAVLSNGGETLAVRT